MKKSASIIIVCLLFSVIGYGAGKEEYRLPDEDIRELLMAPPVPEAIFNASGTLGVVMEADSKYRPLSDILDAGEYRVGGVRINSHNFSGSRFFYTYRRLYLVRSDNSEKISIEGLPDEAGICEVNWSPDGNSLCFVNLTRNETQIYRVTVSSGRAVAKKINTLKANAVFGHTYSILPDGSVIYKAVPESIGEFPTEGNPTGPIIQRSKSKKRAYKTYQDLLKNEYDEKVFDYLTTTVFIHWTENGSRVISEPASVREYSVSPDGSTILSICEAKPYPYYDTWERFPSKKIIINVNEGKASELKIDDAKNLQWRADLGSVLAWTEKKDSVTTIFQSADLCDVAKGKLALTSTTLTLEKIYWGNDKFALFTNRPVKDKKQALIAFSPATPESGQKALVSRKIKLDSLGLYTAIGAPYVIPGTKLLLMDGGSFYMYGNGSYNGDIYGDCRFDSELDAMSFIDRFDPKTGAFANVWTGKAPFKETVVNIRATKKGGTAFISCRESNKTVPQYCAVEVKKGKAPAYRQITDFSNPYPALENVVDRYVTYTRADGVKLAGRLFLPAGYDPAKDGRLPVLMLAYPWEHVNKAMAERRRAPKYSFETPAQTRIIHFATHGYAVLQDFSVPIISDTPESLANANYLKHLVMSAEAAVNCLDSIGVADRERIAVCGRSYGAFMTANLMCHTKLFKLGIAMSGAFNRTLTPFGFQHDGHTYWEIPKVYHEMSPFDYADKLSGHLILTHGITDENTGTYPIQTERMYQALAGNGGDVEYIQFPWESHRLRFKESILHLNYEMFNALDKYLAPKEGKASAAPDLPQWKPIGKRKARVVHWGIIHNHSKGKWEAVQKLSDDYEIVGWVDDTDSKSMRMAEPNKKLYEGYPRFTPEQVFNEVKPDLIVVETANSDLVEIATEIARHGIPMHMDKPLGIEQEGFRKISRLCKIQGLPLQIGYMFRSNEAINKMVELAKSGAFGTIYSVEADMDHNYGYPKYPEYASHYPGGTAYLLSCHAIEWVMPIFDDRLPDKTYSILKPAPADPDWAVTHSLTIMEYPRANVVIRVCSKGTQPCRHIRIDGTAGTMELEPIEDFRKVKHTTGLNDGDEKVKTLDIHIRLKEANAAAKAAGLHEGLNTLSFPAPDDRYAGQLKELARILRGEIPYPAGLYEHDLVVHKVSLDACNLPTD